MCMVNAFMSWEPTGCSSTTEPGVRFRSSCLGLGGWAGIYANSTLVFKCHPCTVLAGTGTHLSEKVTAELLPKLISAVLGPESVSRVGQKGLQGKDINSHLLGFAHCIFFVKYDMTFQCEICQMINIVSRVTP